MESYLIVLTYTTRSLLLVCDLFFSKNVTVYYFYLKWQTRVLLLFTERPTNYNALTESLPLTTSKINKILCVSFNIIGMFSIDIGVHLLLSPKIIERSLYRWTGVWAKVTHLESRAYTKNNSFFWRYMVTRGVFPLVWTRKIYTFL